MGNSLAVVIPAKDAKRAHIEEGVPVHARVSPRGPQAIRSTQGHCQGQLRPQEGGTLA